MQVKAAYPLPVFVLSISFLLSGLAVHAQQQPLANTAPTAALDASQKIHPQDDVLLQGADADVQPANLYSRVSLDYDHGTFSGGRSNNRERIKGQQAFGATHRLGFGYEIPIVRGFGFDLHGGGSAPSGRGLGDIRLNVSAVLGDYPRFKHAATFEVAFPSAPDSAKGPGQTILKTAWGFSTPLGQKTVLNGVLAYNKAVTVRGGGEGIDNFEPEVVLTRAVTARVAAFLDYDSYWDFNASSWGQTLKPGLQFKLDERGRWGLSPYVQFPLNHFTSTTNLKSDVGIELSRRY